MMDPGRPLTYPGGRAIWKIGGKQSVSIAVKAVRLRRCARATDFDLCLPAPVLGCDDESGALRMRASALLRQRLQTRTKKSCATFYLLESEAGIRALPSEEANERVPGQSNCAALPPLSV